MHRVRGAITRKKSRTGAAPATIRARADLRKANLVQSRELKIGCNSLAFSACHTAATRQPIKTHRNGNQSGGSDRCRTRNGTQATARDALPSRCQSLRSPAEMVQETA